MGNISYIRSGTIKSIEETSINIEMNDTNGICTWPLPEEQGDGHITDTLQVGEEVTLTLKISDDPFESSTTGQIKEEHMRKLLESIVN